MLIWHSSGIIDQFGERQVRKLALLLTFGGGDWQKVNTKSVKLEFDDFFNRVIGCAITFHCYNNTRIEGCHLGFRSLIPSRSSCLSWWNKPLRRQGPTVFEKRWVTAILRPRRGYKIAIIYVAMWQKKIF